MTNKIDYCSDLHVDIWANTPRNPQERLWTGAKSGTGDFIHFDWEHHSNQGSKTLVVAGDTANTINMALKVIEQASEVYNDVIVVDGNHEHYNSPLTVRDNMYLIKNGFAKHPRIHYLHDGDTVQIGDIAYIGACGWYDWKGWSDRGINEIQAYLAWQQMSNDSVYPVYADAINPQNLAKEQSLKLAELVEIANVNPTVETIVMVTHTSPSAELMHWSYTNKNWNLLTPSYMNTEMSRVIDADVNKKIKYWIYGHTHKNQKMDLGHITFLNNARGYPKENPEWKLEQIEV